MTVQHLLKDGDELDLIVYNHYGITSGAVEEVMEANADKMTLFDLKGRYSLRNSIDYIDLPSIDRPTTTKDVVRIFD